MARNGSGTYNLVTNSWYPPTNGVSATAADWQSLINDVAAAITQSVSADGQTPITGSLNMNGNRLTGLAAGTATGQSVRWEQLFDQGVEADIASAATVDIGAQNTNFLRITGTTTITSFGTNYRGPRFVRFAAALTLTHNATTLILPTAANITTAAGDRAIIVPVGNPGAGWQVLAYQRADGRALLESVPIDFLNSTRINVASAATVDLTASAPNTRNINITGTTTITAFTVAIGQTYFVRFDNVLTLTNNANIVTNSGANITTAAGDTCVIRATAANTVEVLSYVGRATTAQAQAGTDVSRLLTPARMKEAQIQLGTPVALTTQTAVDFTGIPAYARRVTIIFDGVSTNGTSNPIIQLGDAGGFETTGYLGGGTVASGSGTTNANYTTGFGFPSALATNVIHGKITLDLLNSSTNAWAASGALGFSGLAATATVGGTKTLSPGPLTQVRLTTVGGVDQFDAGSVNITWE